MRVKAGPRIYEMSVKKYHRLLAVASEQVPLGVYAVERPGYAELVNHRCASRSQVKTARRAYQEQGWKVYANG